MRRLSGPVMVGVLLAGATGCITVRTPPFMQSNGERAWHDAMGRALELASYGEAIAADSVMIGFATQYPSSRRVPETSYWRALFRLDPDYGPNGAREALPLIDLYLASGDGIKHREEAIAVKRIAEQMNRLSQLINLASGRAQASTRVAADATARAADARDDIQSAINEIRAQDAEIRRLRNQLATTNAELDRIKKRLAEIQKPPPENRD